MAPLDAAIVIGSLVGLVVLGVWLAARQRATEDFYLGGRRLPAWALGVSLAANQASAISLIGAPAFVALRGGGGLRWLQYELAVPLAMAVLVLWGVPQLRTAKGASVYAGVEDRLGATARRVLAMLFLLGRGAGAGVILYASALVVSVVTGWSLTVALLVVGCVAVAYTTLGGLVADVISDVAQFALLWGGSLVAIVFLAFRLRGEGPLLSGLAVERVRPLVLMEHGLGDGATFALWPMLLGGFFLYLSYYGCDQTQAQRVLAARSADQARRALAVAAFVRFPLVATYCLFGLLLAQFLRVDELFALRLAGKPPDALVPEFLAYAVPVGLRGVAIAGILAAALSSLDSALNSLSAVTLEEIVGPGRAGHLLGARATTALWGVFAVGTGFLFARAGETTIELVNRVGSALYGPILAVFALAWLSRRVTGPSASLGAIVGVVANLTTALAAPGVSWLWWNVVGFVVAFSIGVAAGSGRGVVAEEGEIDRSGRRLAVALVAFFLVMLAGLALLNAAAGVLTS